MVRRYRQAGGNRSRVKGNKRTERIGPRSYFPDASVDPTGALSEILGISTDCSIPSAGIDIRQTASAGGFDVLPFSRNIR
jgi:hypothetical protein